MTRDARAWPTARGKARQKRTRRKQALAKQRARQHAERTPRWAATQ